MAQASGPFRGVTVINKQCPLSGESFDVAAEDLAFYEHISPSFAGKTFPIPPPTLSPVERQRRRLSFRNIRTLYRRSCDATGRTIISCYPPDSQHTVYHSDEWWSDRWDPLSFGRDFDFNRPFFEQFHELYREVPLIHLYQTPNENCDYINGASNCRNCYLSFLLDYCEDVYYLTIGNTVRSTLDSFALSNCELCYECVDCLNCYELRYSERCSGCSNSQFLTNCRECRNCIGCCNLAGKEYYVRNQKVSKEEYARLSASLSSRQAVTEFAREHCAFVINFPRRAYFGQSNEACSGDTITHCRESGWCFDAKELDRCRYCNFFFASDNSLDVNFFGDHSSWLYECIATGLNCSNNSFCMMCWSGSSNNLYCHLVSGTSNCFGCSGLKRAQYCILNKQHTAEEYHAVLPRIIAHMQRTGEWGEFFPSTLSPFPVNISQAHDYFPLTREEAVERGLNWEDHTAKTCVSATQLNADRITDFDPALINQPLRCESCGGQFKIIDPEHRFYQSQSIPPPHSCPECRHQVRAKKRNPHRLWSRQCSRCSAPMMTSYPPQDPAAVFCERCFTQAWE